MSHGSFDRRTFIRVASLAAIGVAAGCSSKEPAGGSTPSPTATGASSTPATPGRKLAWRRLSANGPKARSHHSFTANEDGSIVFLFGGKARGAVLRDAWAYERSTKLWQPLPNGPQARFGHSAAFVDGHLVIFGGQSGNTFFNDTWVFDPVHGKWTKLSVGKAPAARYGASATTIARSMTISHGFSSGRFDDTWALSQRWADVSPPRSSPRPFKRCLHRAVYLPGLQRMVLFGGQTDGTPFLGDTWAYDPTVKLWAERRGAGPNPRTLYAAAGTDRTMYVFGGLGAGGPLNDIWSYDGTTWTRERPTGTAPRRRGALEGAVASGPSMLIFGGTTGAGELADLWELSIRS